MMDSFLIVKDKNLNRIKKINTELKNNKITKIANRIEETTILIIIIIPITYTHRISADY